MVEGACLLSKCGGNSTEGSNPSLSASCLSESVIQWVSDLKTLSCWIYDSLFYVAFQITYCSSKCNCARSSIG